jgi:uncharacterized protein
MFDKIFIKRILILIAIVVMLFLFLLLFPNSNKKTIQINDIKIKAELADTQKERTQGLSLRKSLEDRDGMLFVFDNEDLHGIWMKDMNFSIDILWIDEDYKIIDIKNDARPESYPEVFFPNENAKYVLEINAGFVEMNNIKIKDKIIF